jgi:Transposase
VLTVVDLFVLRGCEVVAGAVQASVVVPVDPFQGGQFDVAVCARWPGPRGGTVTEKHRFPTTAAALARLGGWLADRTISLVAMEATGVYWKPVYYALETSFEVWLCNAHHVKNVPGRKTDMSDAEWLAGVAAHGMVRPSFVTPPPIRELRELTRYRKTQADARVAEIQRLEKVLQDAGVKLTPYGSLNFIGTFYGRIFSTRICSRTWVQSDRIRGAVALAVLFCSHIRRSEWLLPVV